MAGIERERKGWRKGGRNGGRRKEVFVTQNKTANLQNPGTNMN